MKRHTLPVFCLLLLASLSAAGETLMITSTGYWIAKVDAQGNPTWERITCVVDKTGGETPDPDPDPAPTTIAEIVRDWSLEVGDPMSAAGLAEVYRVSAEQLSQGKVNDAQSVRLVSRLSDEVLEILGTEQEWVGFRAKVTTLITTERQKGQYSAETLSEIEAGLTLSTEGAAFGDGVLLQQIIELITVLLPFIIKLITGLS